MCCGFCVHLKFVSVNNVMKKLVMYTGKWWLTYCLNVQCALQTIESAILKVTETKCIKNLVNIVSLLVCVDKDFAV